MPKGINVNVAADTRDVAKAIDQGVVEPLGDAEQALRDLATEGQAAEQKLEQTFREQQVETEKLADAHAKLTRAVRADAYDRQRALKNESDQAAETSRELKNEVLQNTSETFSSWDGSARSFIDGIQGAAGGLIAGFGAINPALLPIAAAAAAAIGLISSSLDRGEQEAEQFRQKVSELGEEFIETGKVSETSLNFILDKLKELATETDPATVNLQKLLDVAQGSGSSFKALAQVYAGNTDELDKLIDRAQRYQQQLYDEAEATDQSTNAGVRAYGDLLARSTQQEKYTQYLITARDAADKAAQAQRNYALAGGPEMEQKVALIESVNSAYDDTASSIDDYLGKESGLFKVGPYIKAMKEREDALKRYQKRLAESGLSDEARAFLVDQGAEAASAMLDGYRKATPAQQKELERIWSEAGATDSGTYADALESGLPKKVKGPSVEPTLDVQQLERDLTLYERTHPTLKVRVELTDQVGNKLP